ncbi:MAG: indolepyruvate oxidoreductase subunit beta [Myxococcota bacterium]
MEQNIILAGVGGQGILTIARVMATAALRRGLGVKQSESHGMSQRGGAVVSHFRVADHALASDLIPLGRAELVIALDPLEALRYVQYLRDDGAIVTSSNAFVNISDYPPIEDVLERVTHAGKEHVLADADRLARAAGSSRSSNMVVLGAASHHLAFAAADLEAAIAEVFAPAGERVREVNLRAFRFGADLARAYREGLQRGGTSRAVRHWLATIPPEHLASHESVVDATSFTFEAAGADALSAAEAHAFERILVNAYESGRRQLYEHEVYTLIQLVGAIAPPRHALVRRGEPVTRELLERFPGERVVLKIVSPEVVHKSDAQGVVFVPKDLATVDREVERLANAFAPHAEGVLLVEHVPEARAGFGSELFVGIRATRELGPVIAAGIGGLDTELLAKKMRPKAAVAKAVALDVTAEEFLDLFRQTAIYDILTGRARGHRAVVGDGELLRCFRAFLVMARRFCVDRGAEGPDLLELEVNPFAFRHGRLVPLDGRGRMQRVWGKLAPRPEGHIRAMLEPRSIGVLGVSSAAGGFGRIILQNLVACGFPRDGLVIVKPGVDGGRIDGVRCVPDVAALPDPTDLLVLAAKAEQVPALVREVGASGKVRSAILIPGGVGETEGSEALREDLAAALAEVRAKDGGTVFLGPNSMGVLSRPGGYDTFFIPSAKLDKRLSVAPRRAALVSQSGAFMLSRLSSLEHLGPALAVSIGNQADVTLGDLVAVIAARDDIDVIGVYAEGFVDLDGLAFVRAVREATRRKKLVVFYKAGRTEPGRSAAAGHTAAVAGDYEVAEAAVAQAGAIVADSFQDFEQLLELGTALHGKRFSGLRLGAMSNAGFEAVGMADGVIGAGYEVAMATLDEPTRVLLRRTRWRRTASAAWPTRGTRSTSRRWPTRPPTKRPRAAGGARGRRAHRVDACRALRLRTTAGELAALGALAERVPAWAAGGDEAAGVRSTPIQLYDALAGAVRARRRCRSSRAADQAVRALGCATSAASHNLGKTRTLLGADGLAVRGHLSGGAPVGRLRRHCARVRRLKV